MLNKLDDIAILIGRTLLGLYFLGPGIAKVFDYTNYVAVMQANEVPLTLVALPHSYFNSGHWRNYVDFKSKC